MRKIAKDTSDVTDLSLHKRKCRGGFNDISIYDGKEVRDKATMALARDWVTRTIRTRDVPRFRALMIR